MLRKDAALGYRSLERFKSILVDTASYDKLSVPAKVHYFKDLEWLRDTVPGYRDLAEDVMLRELYGWVVAMETAIIEVTERRDPGERDLLRECLYRNLEKGDPAKMFPIPAYTFNRYKGEVLDLVIRKTSALKTEQKG